jgi:hypothetical protein
MYKITIWAIVLGFSSLEELNEELDVSGLDIKTEDAE